MLEDEEDVALVEVLLEVADDDLGQSGAHVLVGGVERRQRRHHGLKRHLLIVQVSERGI